MATMTLLEMTQSILSAMDSDDVSDIATTTESLQVAGFIRETYFDLVSGRDWPFLKTYTTLTALGDVDNPTKMRFPTNVNKVYWIKYNKKKVTFMAPNDFQDMIDIREEQTGVIDANGFMTNSDPVYWTTFDDDYVYFDGYDVTSEASLQATNSRAYMLSIPTWTHSNSFTPQLPDKMFPLLLADAKSTCFLNIKQTANAKEERKAQRLRVRMQNESVRNDQAEVKSNSNVNYGRK